MVLVHDKCFKVYDYYVKYLSVLDTYLDRKNNNWKNFQDKGSDFLDDKKSYSLLEWPDRIKGLLPDTLTKVELTHLEEGKREIKITHVC